MMFSMRWVVVLVAGCGFQIGTRSDGAMDRDDAAVDDASVDTIDAPLPDCDAPPTWADGLTPAQTLHVDPLSINSTQDGTAANPFTTISAAVAVATPGTRILLAPRSYQQVAINDLHGTASAPIWIEGPATAPRASFTGTNGIRLNRPQYVVIRHLDFTALTGDAINADEGGQANFGMAHHLVIDDITATGVVNAFQIRGVTDVSIYNSAVTSSTRGAQLWGVHRAVLAKLTFTAMSTTSVQFAAGSRDIVLRQSRITGDTMRAVWIGGNSAEVDFRPLLAATDNYEARDIQVFDNFIDGHSSAVVCASCTNALIANNRITGDLDYVFRVINEHPAGLGGHEFPMPGTLRIHGNAIEVTTNPYGTRMESNTSCATCEYSHNLWLEIDDPPDSTPPLPVPETNGIYGMPSGYDAQGRLCAGGAAIGTGPTVTEVKGTFSGECRTTPRSIGPGEFDGGC